MKIAEALSMRADLAKRIGQMEERLRNSSKVQEGETADEDVCELLKELDGLVKQQETLIYRINTTNMLTEVNGETLTRKIAHRDMLSSHLKVVSNLLHHLMDRNGRYSRSEIKDVKTIDVKDVRQLFDNLSKQLRETDTAIQGINWNVDLLDE